MIKNIERTMLLVVVAVGLGAGACGRPDRLTSGRYQGMVELEQVDLAFELGGRITRLDIHAGDAVTAGQVVAVQDDSMEREQLGIRGRELDVARADLAVLEAGSRPEDVRAARAQLVAAREGENLAKRELDREKTLVARGATPPARLDALEARLAQARGERATLDERVRLLTKGARAEELARGRARVALAEEALGLEQQRIARRTLSAPVDGVVLDVYPEAGEVVAPGTPIASLIDRTRPYADVFVPIDHAGRVRIGQAAALTVDGLDGELTATVERVAPRAEYTPRFVYSPRERPNLVVRVRVRVADPDERLHAGLPAYVRLLDGDGAGAAPAAAGTATAPAVALDAGPADPATSTPDGGAGQAAAAPSDGGAP